MAVRTHTFSQTGAGTSEAVDIIDSNETKVSWMVVVSGTVNYSLEHSLDGANYIANTDAATITSSTDGNYVLPVRSIRVTVHSGTGTATLIVRQQVV